MSAGSASTGRRILLVRPDHLGDVLLTLPAVMTLRQALPDAHISYLVPDGAAPVPRHCPAVDTTIALAFPPMTAWPDPPGWAETVAQAAPALRGRFDLAILPRLDDPVSGALVATAEVPVRVGYAAPSTLPFLTVALPPPDRRHVTAQAIHLALAALDCLGVPHSADVREAPRCFVPNAAEEAEAAAILALVPTTSGIPGPLGGAPVDEHGGRPGSEAGPLVLHPGSGWPLKNWPPRRWGQLAAALARRYGVAPLVTGGPGERELVDAVVDASGGRARGLAARLSLGGLAALYRRARVVVATDGGPLHLAALLGTPVVGLYGPADPLEFSPLGPAERYRIVRAQLPCSPCRTLVDPPCGAAAEPRCVTEVGIDAVLSAAADLLGG